MNKEIIELILNTDKLTQEQKTEIILSMVKNNNYNGFYNPVITLPDVQPFNAQGPFRYTAGDGTTISIVNESLTIE